MNELGIVLLVLFLLVIAFIVFKKSNKPQSAERTQNTDNPNETHQQPKNTENSHFSETAFSSPDHDQNDPEPEPSAMPGKEAEQALKPQSHPDSSIKSDSADSPAKQSDENKKDLKVSEQPNEFGGKHYVLEVDEPSMTGELDVSEFPTLHEVPKFGIPKFDTEQMKEPVHSDKSLSSESETSGTNPEPEVETPQIKEPVSSAPAPKAFVLVIRSNKQSITMQRMHQIMQGLGAKLNAKKIYTYATKPVNGDGYVTIANLLEPGTFETENAQNIITPGVVLILELPTFVTASAAMHDMIMLSRKLVQHLDATLLDGEMKPIRESHLQTMREESLEYDSERLVN